MQRWGQPSLGTALQPNDQISAKSSNSEGPFVLHAKAIGTVRILLQVHYNG